MSLRKIDWKKYYSDDEKESQEEQRDVFVWRKHARLQTFMNKKFEEQNAEQLKKQLEEQIEDLELQLKGLIIHNPLLQKIEQDTLASLSKDEEEEDGEL